MSKENTTMHKSMTVDFQNFQQTDNPGIMKAQCRVAYAGENRNYTRISKEAFEKAIPSIYNVPVVGNWLGNNFGGHDVILESNGNDVTIKNNTIAYGVVPKDANPRWETYTNKFGERVEYFVVDVLLWYERYPEEINFIADNNGVGQSMEIMVTDGNYGDDDYFNIDDFYYSALCLLGKSTENEEEHVEPCFEDAGVNFNLGDNIKSQLDEFSEFIERSGSVMEQELDNNEEVVDTELEDTVNHNEEEVADEETEAIENTEEAEVEDEEVAENEEAAEEESSEDNSEEELEDSDTSEDEKEDKSEETEEVDASLEEMAQRVAELEEENKELKAKVDAFEAEKEDAAKEEVVNQYSKLVSAEIMEELLEKNFSAKELKYELALAYTELVIEKANKEKETKVMAANNFAISASEKEEDADKDKFAIK